MKQKQKKGNGTDEVMQYSCMEEQKKGNSYEIEVEEGKWNRGSYVALLYGGTEEGNSYEIEVEEGKWNRQSYVVLLYGGTEEGKQL